MPRAVSIGECMVEIGPADVPGLFRMGFAGDTFNTAWYLRRRLPADWAVDYVSAVGTDAASASMIGFMEAAGIGTTHVARLPDATVGLYLIELKDGERSFSYWRGQSAAKRLAEDEGRLRSALEGARSRLSLRHHAGDPAPARDRARLLSTLDDYRAQGGRVAFDPNLRLRLWPSPTAMTEAVAEAARHADVALPSFEDDAGAFGDPDPEACARRYAALGAAEVVVKNGAERMVALADGAWHAHHPLPAREVVDTTAAGDSFNAGYLACRLTGGTVAEALARGRPSPHGWSADEERWWRRPSRGRSRAANLLSRPVDPPALLLADKYSGGPTAGRRGRSPLRPPGRSAPVQIDTAPRSRSRSSPALSVR
jgi:2-dehydro-3-deoxygluconokinase